jgi:uncharacterized protein (TIGR02466 family)
VTTECIFPIPIYVGTVDNLDIQKKFNIIHNTLTLENKLNYKKDRTPTHKLSSNNFSDNLIEEYDLFDFKNELMNHLSKYLEEIGRQSRVEQVKITASWMTSFTAGDYAQQHCHGVADISGVYYVKATKDDAKFYVSSPNRTLKSSYIFNHILDKKYIEPTTGTIVLFPGWLEHGVETQISDQERVSISFNLEFIRPHLIS